MRRLLQRRQLPLHLPSFLMRSISFLANTFQACLQRHHLLVLLLVLLPQGVLLMLQLSMLAKHNVCSLNLATSNLDTTRHPSYGHWRVRCNTGGSMLKEARMQHWTVDMPTRCGRSL